MATATRHEPRHYRVLSLGAGVQSSCLALMAAHGEIEPFDYIIFADTGFEPKETYQYLHNWLKKKLWEFASPTIEIAQRGHIWADLWLAVKRGTRFSGIPYWIKMPNGDVVPGPRQCTGDYKIVEKNKKLRELLGYEPRQKMRDHVTMVLGISSDEAHRAKPSTLHWQTNEHPLIDLDMSRWDCEMWFKDHGYPIPPKSACVICPYAEHERWLYIKRTDPYKWEMAVRLDNLIRKGMHTRGLIGEAYLHRNAVPLDQIETLVGEQLQLVLADDRDLFRFECAGQCAV